MMNPLPKLRFRRAYGAPKYLSKNPLNFSPSSGRELFSRFFVVEILTTAGRKVLASFVKDGTFGASTRGAISAPSVHIGEGGSAEEDAQVEPGPASNVMAKAMPNKSGLRRITRR